MILLVVLTLSAILQIGSCVCYFPVEYQGMFASQSGSTSSNLPKYTTITILPDAIPVWGACEHKDGPYVVLYDKTGGHDCMRCFHVELRSTNVVQLHTEAVDRCYASVEEAKVSCPSHEDITARRSREIMLYKSRSFSQEGSIERVFCPFNGAYKFTYNVNDAIETASECPQATSLLQNCPHASQLDIRFQQCTFGDLAMSLHCLGDWKGPDGLKYLALRDSTLPKKEEAKYRCAMYDIDETTGVVHLSFSVDATCTNQLHSPWEGYETMVLQPKAVIQPPSEVKSHACTFPEWARGKWQHLEILRQDVRLQAPDVDKVYQMECLSQHAPHGERYALFSRDQCGQEEFTCIWIKKRAVNVIEFQMSKYPSDHYNLTQTCADDMFLGQHWSTEGRVGVHDEPSCPIQGEHTGILPDASDLCAKLTSDCSSPQRMRYSVSSCVNTSEVYEEREYRCLGRWKEGGVTYTFTHRVDVDTYECFAGVVVNSKEIFIVEAGVNCQRGLQPLAYGMKLVQKATCEELRDRATTTTTSTTGNPLHPPTTSGEATDMPPWWRTAPRNPWQKKPYTTTRKPHWKDQKPPVGAGPVSLPTSITWLLTSPVILLMYRRT